MFKYFLASKSPRRKDLMNQIGIEFEVMLSEETIPLQLLPELY